MQNHTLIRKATVIGCYFLYQIMLRAVLQMGGSYITGRVGFNTFSKDNLLTCLSYIRCGP